MQTQARAQECSLNPRDTPLNSLSSEVTKTQSSLEQQKPRASEDTKIWAATICFKTHQTCYKPAQLNPKLKYKELKDENETYTTKKIYGTESGIQ